MQACRRTRSEPRQYLPGRWPPPCASRGAAARVNSTTLDLGVGGSSIARVVRGEPWRRGDDLRGGKGSSSSKRGILESTGARIDCATPEPLTQEDLQWLA